MSAELLLSLFWILGLAVGAMICRRYFLALSDYFIQATKQPYSAAGHFVCCICVYSVLLLGMAAGKRTVIVLIALFKAIITGLNVYAVAVMFPYGTWLAYLLFCFSDLLISAIVLYSALIYLSGKCLVADKRLILTFIPILIFGIVDIVVISPFFSNL